MQIKNILMFITIILLLSSCISTKKIIYFQDMESGVAKDIAHPLEIKVQPEDKISIIINSKDPQLADLFNLPIVSHRVGMPEALSNNYSQISGYTVSSTGEIDFPVLGNIHIAGLTREEIAARIKEVLINNNLVKDPVVTVEFMNLYVSVLGEVVKPGRFTIDRDKITILDAISLAGDLTIYGKRDAVHVLREEDGKQISYQVDLSSAAQLYSSPVYYLKQNDLVYVEPNPMRVRQSTVNGNNVRSSSFWMSLASLLTTIAVLIVK